MRFPVCIAVVSIFAVVVGVVLAGVGAVGLGASYFLGGFAGLMLTVALSGVNDA